ncbi:MAG: ImmA/IrrE family metallo-endopeptidase [Puia sp.]|nr:ImmA/IrrE family metallo-endopeptidase [Puia sp.]
MAFTFTQSERAAQKVLFECGLQDPTEVGLRKLILGRKAFYDEQPMTGKDGDIVSYSNRSIITVNSRIAFDTRKRFAAAHELGHYEMHRYLRPVFGDTEYDLLNWYRGGPHEIEANEFAAELLMPTEVFHSECKSKGKLEPKLIDHLANRFQVSKTSAILKFVKRGNYPSMAVFCKDNKMKWWKKSEDFYNFLDFTRDSPPPPTTVAAEIFSGKKAYTGDAAKQDIWKSDWFEMKSNEQDSRFFEYCMVIQSYNSTLSLIWGK